MKKLSKLTLQSLKKEGLNNDRMSQIKGGGFGLCVITCMYSDGRKLESTIPYGTCSQSTMRDVCGNPMEVGRVSVSCSAGCDENAYY